MSGFGYHWGPCRGSGEGPVMLVLAVLAAVAGAYAVISWLVMWWWLILGLVTACLVAVAAVVRWLMRLSDRHAARAWSRRPASLTATVIPQVTQGTQPQAIETHYHIHLDPADREAAQVIRTALPGLSGAIITEE